MNSSQTINFLIAFSFFGLMIGTNCSKLKTSEPSSLNQNSNQEPTPTVTGSPTPTPVTFHDPLEPSSLVPAIPHIDTFKTLISNYGKKYCEPSVINAALNESTFSEGNVWYYDGTQVYHHIGRFTNEPSWYLCADHVAQAYRDWVNNLNLPLGDFRKLAGWRVFPHGLYLHYLKTLQQPDREALNRLATRSAYLTDWDGFTKNSAPFCGSSREVAYLINSFLIGAEIGIDNSDKLSQSIGWALGHLDQWFIQKTCLSTTDSNLIMQPFMVGLTTEALIFAYEKTPDPVLRNRIFQKIEQSMDELWLLAWNESQKAMYSNTMGKSDYWPVVNILIGATYSWLWQVSGTDRHRERADKLWVGTMTMDFPNQIWSGKQFSQILRRGFDYLKWRGKPPKSFDPPTKY